MSNSHVTYVGTEVEGKWAGIPTLFMEGSEFEGTQKGFDYVKSLLEQCAVAHLYLGVHNRPVEWTSNSVFNLMKLLNDLPALIVTVEQPLTKVYFLPLAVWNHRVRVILSAQADQVDYLGSERPFEFKLDGRNTSVMFTPTQFIDTTYLRDFHVDLDPSA